MGFAIVNKLCYNVPAVAIIAAATLPHEAPMLPLTYYVLVTYMQIL